MNLPFTPDQELMQPISKTCCENCTDTLHSFAEFEGKLLCEKCLEIAEWFYCPEEIKN